MMLPDRAPPVGRSAAPTALTTPRAVRQGLGRGREARMTLVASMPPTPATAPLAAVRPARRRRRPTSCCTCSVPPATRAVAQLQSLQRCGSTAGPMPLPPRRHRGRRHGAACRGRPRPLAHSGGAAAQRFSDEASSSTEVLNTPALQNAASAASLALDVGQSSGDPVRRLQEALTAAGFPVAQRPPSTPRPNRPTPRSSPRTAFRSPPGGRPARKHYRRWTTTCSGRLHQRHHRPTAHSTNPVNGRRR